MKKTTFTILIVAMLFAAASFAKEIAWLYYGTSNGDIPAPNTGNQQTASLILDVDKDGIQDFVITERTQAPSVVWYKFNGGGWDKFIIETEPLHIEAGGAFYDIDNDGDLDVVFGGDSKLNKIWWWENPYPNFKKNIPWKRRLIKDSGAKKHHDQMFGDFDGDGKVELVSWNQKDDVLLLFEVPKKPKKAGEWKRTIIFKAENARGKFEGLAKADVDQDGKVDIIGAGRWFKHEGGTKFSVHIIDSSPGKEFTRSAAGQLVKGGRPEIVIVPGDANGPLTWYEWQNDKWIPHTLNDMIIHGHSLQVRDIDGDGNADIFVGEMGKPGAGAKARTIIYYGDGKGHFREQVVAVGKANHESKLGDFDGDGDIDVLGKPYNYGSPGIHVWLQAEKFLPLNAWKRYHIDDLPNRSVYIKAGDLDGDGDKDIVAGAWWWENPGQLSGKWAKHVIGEPLKNMFEVFDFDHDGDTDIIGTEGIGSSPNHHFVWARNEGKGSFTILSNIDSCDSGDFLQGATLVHFKQGDKISIDWHKGGRGTYLISIPDDPSTMRWTVTRISPTTLKEDISAGDIDRDGDKDLLLGTIWLENQGDTWIAHMIGRVDDLDRDAEPDRNDLADFNGDGRLDAVIGLEKGTQVLWFEAPQNPVQPWIRHSIGDIAGQGFSMDTKDFDRDGDPDVVIGEHRGPVNNRVVIFQNFDSGRTWSKIVIDKDSKKVIDHHDGVVSVDLDNDGDLDIISIGWYNPKVWVFENKAIN